MGSQYGVRVREFTNRFINRSCLAANGVHKVVAHPADRACLASTSVVFAHGGARDIGGGERKQTYCSESI